MSQPMTTHGHPVRDEAPASCRILELVIDCSDPKRLVRFWAEALSYDITENDPDFGFIEDPSGIAPGISFVRVPDGKAGKNRVHIDLCAEDGDQDREVARLLALGAMPVDIGQGDATWAVLADPEGNEFCVLS